MVDVHFEKKQIYQSHQLFVLQERRDVEPDCKRSTVHLEHMSVEHSIYLDIGKFPTVFFDFAHEIIFIMEIV